MPKVRSLSKPEEIAKVPADESVTIDIREQPEPIVKADTSEPPRSYEDDTPDLAKQLADLKASEEAMRRQAQAAEQARLQAVNEVRRHQSATVTARREAEQSQLDSILNALGAAQTEAEAAQGAYEAALASQDYRMAAEAQRKISRAEAKILQLENGKEAYEARIQEQARQLEQQPAQPQQQTPDQIINNMQGLVPSEREWLRKHPELITDPKNNRILEAAFYEAERRGLQRGTDKYFEFFDERMGFKQTDEDDEMAEEPVRTQQRVSAPPSRSAPSVTRGNEAPSKITLSPQQREAAKWAGIDEVTYAKNLLKLQQLKRNGQYTDH